MQKVESIFPSNTKVAVALRDDDVSYFTEPWMLESVYKEVWRQGFKVSLAVIPMLSISSHHFHNVLSRHVTISSVGKERYSIADNKDLVNYLQRKIKERKVDIVQHGYTHNNVNGQREFAINDFKIVDEKLRLGRALLQDTFQQDITVFAAPHEKISRATWKSLKLNKMCLSRQFTLGRLLTITTRSLSQALRIFQSAQTLNPFSRIPSSIINIDGHYILQWDFLLSANKNFNEQIKVADKMFTARCIRREPYILTQHYWEYLSSWEKGEVNHALLKAFYAILSLITVKNVSVWKTSLSDLNKALQTAISKDSQAI
jgi:predicted deacetylase